MNALAAKAIEQATKAHIPHSPEIIVAVCEAGLPDRAEFFSRELLATIRIDGQDVHMIRDGNIAKTVPLSVIGRDRMLVNFAIARAAI